MKLYLSIILLFCALATNAQKKAIIQGVVDKQDGISNVCLYKIIEGRKVEVGCFPINQDRSFHIEFIPEYEGFYTIGHPNKSTMIYIKTGDKVNLHIEDNMTPKLEGKNTKENKTLYKWLEHASTLIQKGENWMECPFSSTYKDFFPDFENMLKELPEYRKTLKIGNKLFDALLDRTIDYQMDYWAMRLLWTPRSIYPTDEECPDFFREMLDVHKIDNYLLCLPYGRDMLQLYYQVALRFYTNKDTREANKKMVESIADEHVREIFVWENILQLCKGYQELQTQIELYAKHLRSAEIKKQMAQLEAELKSMDSGEAPDFTYPDTEGKMVSLSDFRGKVVLIDVWATWCGPCQAQIPHLVKLEEELKDSGIVFLGVSIDEEKNKGKWLKMVEEKGLKGLQLFSNGGNQVTKNYKITHIPRFIIIGEDGNIVAKQAPRPSDPVLKQILLKIANK